MKIIKFSFVAPLQSWGEDARWDERTTASSPTKSGIVGFLGCCLGYERGDTRINQLNEKIEIAIRSDRPGEIIKDFHTVSGNGTKILNAQGEPRCETIFTPKYYLQNSWFTVYLQGDDRTLEECYAAMKHPKWTPYLGRKNCVPSVPVIPEWVEAETLEDAASIFSDSDRQHCEKYVAVEIDYSAKDELKETERTYSRKDFVIHSEKNEYKSRFVKSYTVLFEGGGMT